MMFVKPHTTSETAGSPSAGWALVRLGIHPLQLYPTIDRERLAVIVGMRGTRERRDRREGHHLDRVLGERALRIPEPPHKDGSLEFKKYLFEPIQIDAWG